MVVYDLKDTSSGMAATAVPPKQRRKEIIPALPVTEMRSVDQLLQTKWGREKKKRQRRPLFLDAGGLQRVRKLTEQVNANLDACGILIHLVLIEDENGFAIDVYDCSGGRVCEVIHDMEIELHELPRLLVRLQMEAGIIVDRVL